MTMSFLFLKYHYMRNTQGFTAGHTILESMKTQPERSFSEMIAHPKNVKSGRRSARWAVAPVEVYSIPERFASPLRVNLIAKYL
jgi:hypothetical protein